jgi:hypothetical protein
VIKQTILKIFLNNMIILLNLECKIVLNKIIYISKHLNDKYLFLYFLINNLILCLIIFYFIFNIFNKIKLLK